MVVKERFNRPEKLRRKQMDGPIAPDREKKMVIETECFSFLLLTKREGRRQQHLQFRFY